MTILPSNFSPRFYSPYVDSLTHFYEAYAKFAIKLIERPISSVLDIGSGTGHFTAALAKALPNYVKVIGIDSNSAMTRYSRKWQSENIAFHNQEASAFLKKTHVGHEHLILFKGSYHLMERSMTADLLLDLISQGVAVCIVERTSLSASTYPLPKLATHRLMNLCGLIRQKKLIERLSSKTTSLRTAAYGKAVDIPTKAYRSLVLHRQMSYLQDFKRRDLEKWADANLPKFSISVFEEHRFYLWQSNSSY